MFQVTEYQVVEKQPGYFNALVQRQGLFRRYWRGVTYHGDETYVEYATTEFSVRAAERLIEKHKAREVTPWVPKTVYRESL